MDALSWIDPSKITILFLARYAPRVGDAAPPLGLHPIYGVAPSYNYEVFKVLIDLSFRVLSSSEPRDLIENAAEVDYVFSLYNQAPFRASEVLVPSICEYLRLPYLGGPPDIRALAQDKHLAKIMARFLRIPTPRWQVYSQSEHLASPKFVGPYILKPRFGAGSNLIDESSVTSSWEETRRKIEDLFSHGTDVILEEFVEGSNVTCAVIGGAPPAVLPLVRSRSTLRGDIQTAAQKQMLQGGLERSIFQDDNRSSIIRKLSLRLFRQVQPLDYTRIDFRVPFKESKEPVMLEFNVCPNLGSHSSIVAAGRHKGITQKELVASILDYSFRRQRVTGDKRF